MGVLVTEEGESLQVTWDMSGAVLVGCRMAKGPQFVFPVLQGRREGWSVCNAQGELPSPHLAGMFTQPRKRER